MRRIEFSFSGISPIAYVNNTLPCGYLISTRFISERKCIIEHRLHTRIRVVLDEDNKLKWLPEIANVSAYFVLVDIDRLANLRRRRA